jgi:hypothetical protein
MVKPSGRGPMVEHLERLYCVGERRACRVLRVPRATYRYRSCLDPRTELRMRIREIAQTRVRYGYRKIRVLLNREGWNVGKHLVYRLYCEEGLCLQRMRPAGKRKAATLFGILDIDLITPARKLPFMLSAAPSSCESLARAEVCRTEAAGHYLSERNPSSGLQRADAWRMDGRRRRDSHSAEFSSTRGDDSRGGANRLAARLEAQHSAVGAGREPS